MPENEKPNKMPELLEKPETYWLHFGSTENLTKTSGVARVSATRGGSQICRPLGILACSCPKFFTTFWKSE